MSAISSIQGDASDVAPYGAPASPPVSAGTTDQTDIAFVLRLFVPYYDESYPLDILTPGPPVAPTLTSLSPSAIVANAPAKRVTVTGTGFTHAAVVHVDGAGQATGYISPTQVSYMAQASSAGSQHVTVRNAESAPSNSLTLTVTATAAEAEAAEAAAAKPKRKNGGAKLSTTPEPEPDAEPAEAEPEAEPEAPTE